MKATEWGDWCEWKARCALALCNAETRERLAGFAAHRLRMAARRAAGRTNLAQGVEQRLPAAPEQAWHLLESHAVNTHTRQGKAYKDWLFARVQAPGLPGVAILEAGVSLMMRDVARNFLRNECLPAGTCSLDAPIPGTDQLAYRDLLPDTLTPADEVAARELDAMVKREGAVLFARLSFRLRIGVLAKLEGVVLSDPRVLACCGCGKSLLSREVRALFMGLPEYLQERCPDASQEDRHALAVAVIGALGREATAWARVENVLPELFG